MWSLLHLQVLVFVREKENVDFTTFDGSLSKGGSRTPRHYCRVVTRQTSIAFLLFSYLLTVLCPARSLLQNNSTLINCQRSNSKRISDDDTRRSTDLSLANLLAFIFAVCSPWQMNNVSHLVRHCLSIRRASLLIFFRSDPSEMKKKNFFPRFNILSKWGERKKRSNEVILNQLIEVLSFICILISRFRNVWFFFSFFFFLVASLSHARAGRKNPFCSHRVRRGNHHFCQR